MKNIQLSDKYTDSKDLENSELQVTIEKLDSTEFSSVTGGYDTGMLFFVFYYLFMLLHK